MSWSVGVDEQGAVLLGQDVVADGFRRHSAVRVQTHVHVDHMHRFSSSKGVHDLVMHSGTRDLLLLEGHPDLEWRDNAFAVQYDVPTHFGGFDVTLIDAQHMLGSAQVQVEYSDGLRVGYSGDFSWPLRRILQVDELVVDASYGSDKSVRRFPPEDAEAALLEVVSNCLKTGPVVVKAHRGTLHRAATILCGAIGYPVAATERVKREMAVYSTYGLPIEMGDDREARERGVLLLGHADPVVRHVQPSSSTVTLTGFRMRSEPIRELSPGRVYSIGLSDHADFEETIEYVRNTGATRVQVDNTRHGNGVELAIALAERLGIETSFAVASPDPY